MLGICVASNLVVLLFPVWTGQKLIWSYIYREPFTLTCLLSFQQVNVLAVKVNTILALVLTEEMASSMPVLQDTCAPEQRRRLRWDRGLCSSKMVRETRTATPVDYHPLGLQPLRQRSVRKLPLEYQPLDNHFRGKLLPPLPPEKWLIKQPSETPTTPGRHLA